MRLVGYTTNRVRCSFVLSAVFCCMMSAGGQDITKKRLDHDAYDRWNTITQDKISNDGHWIMYTVQNGAINGVSTTHFFNQRTNKRYTVAQASSGMFTHDSRYAIYRVIPKKSDQDSDRASTAKPHLEYLELSTGKVIRVDTVRSFSTPDQSGRWLVCHLESAANSKAVSAAKSEKESYRVTSQGLAPVTKPLKLKSRETLAQERGLMAGGVANRSEPESKKIAEKKIAKSEQKVNSGDDEEDKKEKQAGRPLLLVDLETGLRRTYPNITSWKFSKDGAFLALVTSVDKNSRPSKEDADSKSVDRKDVSEFKAGVDGVHVVNLSSFASTALSTEVGEYRGLAFSDDGSYLAFLGNHEDYKAKSPSWSVYLTSTKKYRPLKIASEQSEGVPQDWWIASRISPRFSMDNARVYFDTEPIPDGVMTERQPKKGEKKEVDSKKKAKLDLWHWKDPMLQPQQLLRADSERKRTYLASYHLRTRRVSQLEDSLVPSLRIDDRSLSPLAVANTNLPYLKTLSWDYPGFQDVYLIDLDKGERRRISEKVRWNASLSPEGKYLCWFDAERRQWFTQSTQGSNTKPIQVSQGLRYPLQNELHDTPNLPRPYGLAGWLNDDQSLLVYDRYDIWCLDPTGKQKPRCLTMGEGRKHSTRYRYVAIDSEALSIDPNELMILSAFDTKTKASGYSSLHLAGKEANSGTNTLKRLIMLDEAVGGLDKSKNSDQVSFTRTSFKRCADLWTSDLSFQEITRVSEINPQQEEYSWGTAELVHWKATDGQKLDGILMKPDDFDPTRKYPMMVYFYERNSDNLHRYYTPAAGRSIICHSFYVSRGYLVFVPDIPYKTGQPGPSAINAILPGVDALVERGFVHEDRIGLQGHSWGGYQTAYLVTQTNRFACAESGAPVSNMTSAYGGIRWGSGMSRMFQYERTQSRIGEDLWEARDKYVANSPLFFADQINTPLLILHNDQDGAVPWYQGIELFVALRRLGRPAWMLNYNGEPHWVMDDYNRRDFAKRMQQFFDHYLLDAPEPQWMAVGIPATQKGEEYGLELLEPAGEDPGK